MKNRFLDKLDRDFYNESTVKKFILSVILLFLFSYFQESICAFIKNNLLVNNNYSSPILDYLIIVCFVFLTIYLFDKLLKKRYLPSSSEYFIFGILLFTFIYYRILLSYPYWDLDNLIVNQYFAIKYLDLPIALLSIYFVFNSIRYCFSIVNNTANSDEKKNKLISDDPIYNSDKDILGYSEIVSNVSEILLNETHEKSISIGLVGPWGNGKSSVLNLIEKQIKTNKSYRNNDIILIHFLPYLNHNENDIINEFFTTLSNKINDYSGKLSNQLITYSQKLSDLYNEKNIGNFLNRQLTSIANSSANELYLSIDNTLKEINKKIIVFVDDLDRLDQAEILQVLKLIRNTANFTNTFFVVAMDKEYVISRLKKSDDILDAKFIDKFFQLEIYLPEIDSRVLQKYFIDELQKPFDPSPDLFGYQLQIEFNKGDILFNDYVKNFRDAKKVINQIKYDLSLYKEDFSYLNLKDFVNFTFFKLKFPKVMKDFNEKRTNFLTLEKSNSTYKLNQVETKDSTEVDHSFHFIYESLNNEKLNDYEYLSKYSIYKDIITENYSNELKSINFDDKLLLIKTLAYLFGDENKIEGIDSIKYVNNFRMLMQQRIFKNYFKQSEFEELFVLKDELLIAQLDHLSHSDKLIQLIDRLKYFSTSDKLKLKAILEYVALLYNNSIKHSFYQDDISINYNLLQAEVYSLLEKFIGELQTVLKDQSAEEYIDVINELIFENSQLLNETKLTLLGNIGENNQWILDNKYIIQKTETLYTEYLKKFHVELWDVNNYGSYHIYNSIKNINQDKINEIYKEFWKKNQIELLCAQSIEIDPYSYFRFRITESVIEIFENKHNFIEFVQKHSDSALSSIKEFLKLFELLQIINFYGTVNFSFTVSKLMLDKIDYVQNRSNTLNLAKPDNFSQVFIKTNLKDLSHLILNNSDIRDKYLLRNYKFKDELYFVMSVQKEGGAEKVKNFFETMYTLFNEFDVINIDINIIVHQQKFDLGNGLYMQIIHEYPLFILQDIN